MDSKKELIYPIGWQSFEKIRREGALYVDKTAYVAKLVRSVGYAFLSRPRRFGKSLLLSTLQAYFEGKKDLFDGLEICNYDLDWNVHPVLRFDFSETECQDTVILGAYLNRKITEYETQYSLPISSNVNSVGERFGILIERLASSQSQKVVILIDEYDKGVIEVINNAEVLERNQQLLQPFFAQLKSQDVNIRFAMVTGVARFRHYSLFSGMNNLDDISFDKNYVNICGITTEELKSYFPEGINSLAKEYGLTSDQILDKLTQKYDGYRFTKEEIYLFNPFSLLNVFSKVQFGDYWLLSGTSKVFVNYLSKSNFSIDEISNLWVTETRLSSQYDLTDPVPLLFQTGYLTIADYDKEMEDFRLRIPNGEVRNALVNELAPLYLGIKLDDNRRQAKNLSKYLEKGNISDFIKLIDSLIASVPYYIFDKNDEEKSYHLIMYMICLLIGVETRCEEPMADGRPDLVVITKNIIYIFEFKLDHSAKEALFQIKDRGYFRAYQNKGKSVYRIGASFSSKMRNIASWIVEKPDGEVEEFMMND